MIHRHGDVTATEKSNSNENFKTTPDSVANAFAIGLPETQSVSVRDIFKEVCHCFSHTPANGHDYLRSVHCKQTAVKLLSIITTPHLLSFRRNYLLEIVEVYHKSSMCKFFKLPIFRYSRETHETQCHFVRSLYTYRIKTFCRNSTVDCIISDN